MKTTELLLALLSAIMTPGCAAVHQKAEQTTPSTASMFTPQDLASTKNGEPSEAYSGDQVCASKLARIYSAMANLNFHLRREPGSLPSRGELAGVFSGGRIPSCRATGDDYFLANEGPEPTNNPRIIAYERGGNHGRFRHVLLTRRHPSVGVAVIIVAEDDWQKMRENPDYEFEESIVKEACPHLRKKMYAY